MQEHIDAAKIVRRDVDLLPVKAVSHILLAENFGKLQQERSTAAGGVVYFVHPRLADDREACQKLGDFLRRIVFAAALAGIRSVHPHEVFIGVAEGIDRVVPIISQLHFADAVEKFHELCIALLHRSAELVAVDVEIFKKPRKIVFTRRAGRRGFNVVKHLFQRFIEVFIRQRSLAHIGKKLARQDEVPLLLYEILALRLRLFIGQCSIVKRRIPRRMRLTVEVVRQLLRDIAIKKRAQDILLEIPAIHRAAQIVRNLPDRPMQLRPLHFLLIVHRIASVASMLF